ncbi:MAG TPA: fimbria/pilus periplasmic chaperone [Caulobacteraceae bacterium]|nr:fimbria/pilus periplasmic chaperone [Caulobacteraceae bacterium]
MTRRAQHTAAALAAAVLACAATPNLAAAGMLISPVVVEVDPDKTAAVVRITNQSQEPTSIRVRALSWGHRDGRDIFEETADVIVSPPMATIAPGATQVLRVGERTRTGNVERAFRVVIEQVPADDSPQGVRMAMRLDLPMYSGRKGSAAPRLQWRGLVDRDGFVTIEAHNTGATHESVTEVSAPGAGVEPLTLAGSKGVVLPGGAKRWKLGRVEALMAANEGAGPIRVSNPSRSLTILVRTAHGESRQTIALETP